MKRLTLCALLAGLACASSNPRDTVDTVDPFATVKFIDVDGQPSGTASLYYTAGGVRITTDLPGLPFGHQGFHFHAVGRCDPPDFKSAGAHFNPTGARHGGHLGDLKPIREQEQEIWAYKLRPTGMYALLDEDGVSLVVHRERDDFRTDPDGKSGARVRCGVVVPR